ncbi:tetratricopeptide repeat protein [Goodfellowiella coeruleoviolacea]|nr:tetratricopeptide repeat protein [Goodfellowiella coeruleoviolacea]
MSEPSPHAEALAEVIAARQAGDPERARDLVLRLVERAPDDVHVAYQAAWVHDLLGLEADAVPHYVRALARPGLPAEDRRGALLGLGSTYRTLGRYPEAVATLEQGVAEFPEHRPLRVFLAMAQHNAGRSKQAVESLLTLLVETTSDPEIAGYQQAIARYAEDLDRTWPSS